jgi:cytochrome c-type biogenesis protein CcmE
VRGDPHSAGGLRFGLKNIQGRSGVVPVVYHGASPPPLFKVGRSVVVTGRYSAGRLGATDIVTKCPSKYTAKPSA